MKHGQVKLTPLQKEYLMECHERELLKMEPLNVTNSKFSGYLITMGLMEVRPVEIKSKKVFGLFLTHAGRQALEQAI